MLNRPLCCRPEDVTSGISSTCALASDLYASNWNIVCQSSTAGRRYWAAAAERTRQQAVRVHGLQPEAAHVGFVGGALLPAERHDVDGVVEAYRLVCWVVHVALCNEHGNDRRGTIHCIAVRLWSCIPCFICVRWMSSLRSTSANCRCHGFKVQKGHLQRSMGAPGRWIQELLQCGSIHTNLRPATAATCAGRALTHATRCGRSSLWLCNPQTRSAQFSSFVLP